MGKERLTAAELREVEQGTHLIIDLHEDEHWRGAEGDVEYVSETRSGHTIGITPLSGPQHTSRLKIPSDARRGLWFTGVAHGAKNLRVGAVYERNLY